MFRIILVKNPPEIAFQNSIPIQNSKKIACGELNFTQLVTILKFRLVEKIGFILSLSHIVYNHCMRLVTQRTAI